MNEVKPHLSYEGQINKLREKGCIIDDDSLCRDVLVNIGYYRLSAYFLPFKNFDGTYMDNLSFERVYRVYEFDRKLRNLLFSAIEVIEVSLRTRLAHFHSEKYGPLGYLDASSFNSKHNADKFHQNIEREIENNKKVLFVKHHIDNYDGQFPLWVISELFTFGMLSYFYNDLTTADKPKQKNKERMQTVNQTASAFYLSIANSSSIFSSCPEIFLSVCVSTVPEMCASRAI